MFHFPILFRCTLILLITLSDSRDLQDRPVIPTEKAIRSFVERYGSVPRFVYGDASQPECYEAILTDKMSSFKIGDLVDAVWGAALAPRDYNSIGPPLSHMIIHTNPDTTNRLVASRGVPTRHIMALIYDHFASQRAVDTPTRLSRSSPT